MSGQKKPYGHYAGRGEGGHARSSGQFRKFDRGAQNPPVLNRDAHSPELLGEPFHNPYTFLPFPESAPPRFEPTPRTIDQKEQARYTGILDLEIELLSPLLSSALDPRQEQKTGHQQLNALRIGDDVVLPASGVRGALKSLMTVLSGGTLSFVDEDAWLCQARDIAMGEERCRLARVKTVAHQQMDGEIEIGETRFPNIEEIAFAICDMKTKSKPVRVQPPGTNATFEQIKKYTNYLKHDIEPHLSPYRPRSTAGGYKIPRLYAAFQRDRLVRVSKEKNDGCDFELKLSETPIGLGKKRPKREGAFKGEKTLRVRAKFWRDFSGRHRHANKRELMENDLVWLELKNNEGRIESESDIASFQWARWGRGGESLLEVIKNKHPHMLPDAMNPDGKVDMVTDLFGHVPTEIKTTADQPGPAAAFSARVRPANLVFHQGAEYLKPNVALAPLSSPNPGCAAFYRKARSSKEASFADDVNNQSKMPLRGFKVYRTSQNDSPPWSWDTQPIYNNKAEAEKNTHNMNKTVELLMQGLGNLRVSLSGLCDKEMGLLFSACAVDWRLGGGKPLGLGWCRVRRGVFRPLEDDGRLGSPIEISREGEAAGEVPEKFLSDFTDIELCTLKARMEAWQATQIPVARMRYPRAVEHEISYTHGGHTWFQRHATPKKQKRGLQVMHVHKDACLPLKPPAIQAQPLPTFDPKTPLADKLFGYDLFVDKTNRNYCEQTRNKEIHYKRLEPFDPGKHGNQTIQPGPNRNPNSRTRKGDRSQRKQGDHHGRK
ncbi:MAG: hypothetical protein JJU29_12680 [Verrucomicrobia bacterium]|nr:hypothetical protein [Verrucomicrobiota bacterium]